MVAPVRLQLSRRKGFDLQALSLAANGLPVVNVARPTLWSNPFLIGEPSGHLFKDDGDPTPLIPAMSREQVIAFYGDLVSGFLRPEMHPAGHQWMDRFRKTMRGQHPTEAAWGLKGKNLACWCKPGEACHADVLLEIANPAVIIGENR